MQKGSNIGDFDGLAVLRTLWAGRFVIALCTAICLFIGGYYALFAAVPLYRAEATVMLDAREETVVDLTDVMGNLSGDASVVASEVEVLRARGLMGKVVDRLGLTRDPEFNPGLRPPGFAGQLKARAETWRAAQMGEGLAEATPDPDPRNTAIDLLLAKTAIRNIPKSLVFEVSAVSTDPAKAARIADTIVELYILNQIEVKFDATAQATGWLSTRVAELQSELEANEARVKAFTAENELVTPEALAALERQMKAQRDLIDGAGADLAAKEARLTDQMTPEARAKAEAAIVHARRALILLIARKDELATRIEAQSQSLIALRQLTREAEASRLLYEYFLARLKETSVQQGIQQADSRVLSPAVAPRHPAAPKRGMILAMAGAFGLVLGVGLVLLNQIRDTGFRSARELEEATGLTVLGQVPLIRATSRHKTLGYLRDRPASAAAESVRNLRTSVLLSNLDAPPQVIVSTSSVPGEGKTTNSMALALNLAGMGKRVLLIEGDIRRRVFPEYLAARPRAGLISVLSGAAPLSDAIRPEPAFGFDVIFGEHSLTNAADLFSAQVFHDLIAHLRRHYDVIVIDSPPVLVVPDARILAQVADAVLFTVKWDSTTRTQVEDALRLFASVNCKVAGLVLAQVDPRGMKRYGYGEAYAGYGTGYYAA